MYWMSFWLQVVKLLFGLQGIIFLTGCKEIHILHENMFSSAGVSKLVWVTAPKKWSYIKMLEQLSGTDSHICKEDNTFIHENISLP
jgi:hypothetical protein